MRAIGDRIVEVSTSLTEFMQLNVHLIVGDDYAVWVDSGVTSMWPELRATMEKVGVRDRLRFVLHTHSHHDHIGANAQLKAATGCMVAAPGLYAHWHTDFEVQYQELARAFPELVPDTPELRAEVLNILDGEHRVELHVDEGCTFDLGGGVTLEAVSLPGHVLAELAWYEASSSTMIVGDAVTGLDWPQFHSHLSVAGYRKSLKKLRDFLEERRVERVVFGHFPPSSADEAAELTHSAERYIDEVEATIIRICATADQVTLEQLWHGVCARMRRRREWRALNMVAAHAEDLIDRGIFASSDGKSFLLR